jgi:hypothetical protein
MRAHEFITEAKKDTSSAHQFPNSVSEPMPSTYAFPGLPANDPYRAYRFAMAMANHDLEHANGPTSQLAVMTAYTKGDEQIIQSALRHTGERSILVAKKGSREPTDVNISSPVAQIKKNRWGV